jgi:hypothetical protein
MAARRLLRILSRLPSRILPAGLSWIAMQDLFLPRPANMTSTAPERTVILGAGVIGLSTAYYLATALNETRPDRPSPLWPPVVVVESSGTICPAASGQATGVLSDFAFSPEVSPLGLLPYRLHKELASNFDGKENWGYSDLDVVRLTPKGFTGTPSPSDSWGPGPPVPKTLSDLPMWIDASEDWAVHLLANAPHAAHLYGSRNLFKPAIDALPVILDGSAISYASGARSLGYRSDSTRASRPSRKTTRDTALKA